MRVWRLARKVYPVLDGDGARRYGGRWNDPGTPVVYTAAHLSLAVLELLVNLDADLIPADLTAYEIDVPDGLEVEAVDRNLLPEGWNTAPECKMCRAIGQRWAKEARAAVLSVPSSVVPGETNYLINPQREEASRVRVVAERPFSFDPRLFKRNE